MFSFLFGKSKKKQKEAASDGLDATLGSQLGSHAARNQAEATNIAIEGMNALGDMAERLKNVGIGQKQGNLFELIEATKFNTDAAVKGDDVRAYVTALEGDPHAKADILIRRGNQVLEEVQAKSSNDPARLTRMISDPKYNGMQKLANSDKADRVRELAEKRAGSGSIYSEDYRDTVKNLTGKLKHGEVSSSGTTYDEAVLAGNSPDAYRSAFEWQQIKKEIGATSAQSAAASTVIGGAMSLVKNGIAVSRGEITTGQAAKNVAVDAGKAGVRGGVTGALSAGIRVTAEKAGIAALAKSNVATGIAAGVVDIGVTVFRYAKGEVDSQEAMEKIGQTGLSTASSMYAGAAAGAVFGPVGAVIGSMAGYMVATGVYQSALAISRDARLAEEEAQRIIVLCEAAQQEMIRQREEFEYLIQQKLQTNAKEFKRCFEQIDRSVQSEHFGEAVAALEDFSALFGKKLKLGKFEDFDQHMKSGKPLIL
ncbi:hypothetical protein [Brevibacillus dissolubilis]|uniref:hypothetical protein n=1 Tax=Brevibacillus dissolubilis TaxID=1844116 RepID=UPI0011175FFD|nr:hypothetical protein [Brevibacillus dissolubilis]